MVQVKEAVKKAQSYLPEVFPESTGNDLLLEGVELSDDSQFWKITFSYPDAGHASTMLGRNYRTIKLRAEDGEFFGARNGLL